MQGYITKSEAAERMGVSTKTLERMVGRGEGPAVKYRPRSGNRPEPMYRESDVENLAPQPKTEVMAPGDPRLPRPGLPTSMPAAVATVATVNLQPLATAFEALAGAILTRFPAPRPEVKQWLTPSEAAQYLGLSEGFLRRLIRSGRLPFTKDGHSFKVSKASCDSIDSLAGLSQLKLATAEVRQNLAQRKANG